MMMKGSLSAMVLAAGLLAAGAAPCAMRTSGSVRATADNEVIELLSITNLTGVGVVVDGFRNVTVRNVDVVHGATGPGISISRADGLRLVNVSVRLDAAAVGGAPVGPLPNSDAVDVVVSETDGATVDGLRTRGGSTGIYLVASPRARLSRIEGRDARGPFPRGQCVQFDKCDHAILEDFSCESGENASFTEDNVNVYMSDNVTVRRGLVDGNNSPDGAGIMIESGAQVGLVTSGLVEDVDALRQGDGCFAAWGVTNVVFRRCRSAMTHCGGEAGRGKPQSGALVFAGGSEGKANSSGLRIEDGAYDALCRDNLVWPGGAFAAVDLKPQPFTPRPPVRNAFCWEYLGAFV